jgi:hypothetical protein
MSSQKTKTLRALFSKMWLNATSIWENGFLVVKLAIISYEKEGGIQALKSAVQFISIKPKTKNSRSLA